MTNEESNPAASVTVRFDGVYQSGPVYDPDVQMNHWRYLRFYSDGTVLMLNMADDDREAIATFLNVDVPQIARGMFVLTGREISFSAITEKGTVDYIGDVQGARMILRIHSHMNGNRGVAVFRFRKIWESA